MNGWFGFGNARVKLNADIPKVGWIVRSLALDCATNQQIDFILTRQRQFLKLSGIDKLHKLRGNQDFEWFLKELQLLIPGILEKCNASQRTPLELLYI